MQARLERERGRWREKEIDGEGGWEGELNHLVQHNISDTFKCKITSQLERRKRKITHQASETKASQMHGF